MDLLFQLKGEVDALKAVVESLKAQSVEKICAEVLDGFNSRLTRLEGQVRGIETALNLMAKPEGEAGRN